ncbi:MAG: DUF1003 domain-containing protein [Pseudomonadota bacterium]|nr:DUF1003 domain-containing protein [Pseudomonadota bacterium]
MTEKRHSRSRRAHWQGVGRRTEEILNVRSEMARRRTRLTATIDRLGRMLAHPAFFLVLLAAHLLWIALNLPLYPGFRPWDPYPFVLLATIASVEAPFIALLVLMRQWRDSRIDELRDEIGLQVALHVERQTTMVLRLLDEMEKHLDIRTRQDPEILNHMEENLDPQHLMTNLHKDLQKAEEDDGVPSP